jgi:hypothetical protein
LCLEKETQEEGKGQSQEAERESKSVLGWNDAIFI